MARLPDYTALGQRGTPQPPQSVADIQVPLRPGPEGELYERAGGELQRAGDLIDQTNKRWDAVAAEAGLNDLQQKSIDMQYDPQTGFRNVQGYNAMGQQFFKDQMQRFQAAASSISDNLQSPQQKQLFQQRVGIAGNQYRSALLAHQAQQTENFATATEGNTVKVELQNISKDPYNETTFQTGLMRINGVIGARGMRKGEPAAETELTRQQAGDAAWATRIKTINDDAATPGGGPYAAEKMFREHSGDLGAANRIQLGNEIQHEVQNLQANGIAQNLTLGRPVLSPETLVPATMGVPPLQGVVQKLESGGVRYDKNGKLLVSPAGAQGEMQVMPETAKDPGYGVTPARDDSPEEIARVGRDYLGAMTARYQDPALALAAYNAGPTQVDKWLATVGDPRSGQITQQDWASKIPFKETRDYVARGLQALGPRAPVGSGAPTAHEMMTLLPALEQQAHDVGIQMYPNNPAFADKLVARVSSYGGQMIRQYQAQAYSAQDTIVRAMLPDQSGNSPQSMEQLLSDPRVKAVRDRATPEFMMQLENHFALLGRRSEQPTAESTAQQYRWQGIAINDPETFLNTDLSTLLKSPKNPDGLPISQFSELSGLQLRMSLGADKTAQAQQKQESLLHAIAVVQKTVLPYTGIKQPKPGSKADDPENMPWNQFTAQLSQEIDQFQAQNKRRPGDDEVTAMAQGLTKTVELPGKIFGSLWTRHVHAFELQPGEEANVLSKPPPDFVKNFTSAYVNKTGMAPSQAELATAYVRSLHTPPKAAAAQKTRPQFQRNPAPLPGQPPFPNPSFPLQGVNDGGL